MKGLLILLLTCTCFSSCQKAERGTLESEILSKKLFDSVRQNDFDKSTVLMPDGATYRKICKMIGTDTSMPAKIAYDTLVNRSRVHFNTLRTMVADWDDAKYLNSNLTQIKGQNLNLFNVVTKIQSGSNSPCKYGFTASKYNNRWYYLGDIYWIQRSDSSGVMQTAGHSR